MTRGTKIALFSISTLIKLYLICSYYQYLQHEKKRSYAKGIDDCVDNFVKGFAFTNGETITIESKHNGSITVKTIR